MALTRWLRLARRACLVHASAQPDGVRGGSPRRRRRSAALRVSRKDHCWSASSYARSDDEHTGRAIVLISDPAHIYQGSLDHSFGHCIGGIPPRTDPPAPGPASQVTVLITVSEVTIILAALDIAADYQRDRAGLCADCTGQTCPACESRQRDAQAYDHLSAQLIRAASRTSQPQSRTKMR